MKEKNYSGILSKIEETETKIKNSQKVNEEYKIIPGFKELKKIAKAAQQRNKAKRFDVNIGKEYSSPEKEIPYFMSQGNQCMYKQDYLHAAGLFNIAYDRTWKSDLSDEKKKKYLEAIKKRVDRTLEKIEQKNVLEQNVNAVKYLVETGQLIQDRYGNFNKVREKGLLKKLFSWKGTPLIILIIGILGLINSLSFNVTGNAIINLSQKTNNVFGLIFATLCIIGIFLYFNKKNNHDISRTLKCAVSIM